MDHYNDGGGEVHWPGPLDRQPKRVGFGSGADPWMAAILDEAGRNHQK